MRIGSDTGGTFTDIVSETGEITKVLSTPADPSLALKEGLKEGIEEAAVSFLAHGTTVATNAILERKVAPTALITNEGFSDVIEIGRQNRPSLYDPFADRAEPLVPRHLRYGIAGRIGPDGKELEPLDLSSLLETSLSEISESAAAVAVCLLHSDLNPSHEKELEQKLQNIQQQNRAQRPEKAQLDVSCSYNVAPEFREYERTSTTVMNACLRPVLREYLQKLNKLAEQVLVMTSAGGLVPADWVAEVPVRLLLSGPAGGVVAAAHYAQANGYADSVSFDMGGTSTDICLILNGQPAPAAEREMAGLPVRVPALDILTIGAGGGSIARIDSGGALVVGPQSAGASPGPACYGLGGELATVTDANLAAGRIPADASFLGLGQLDLAAAKAALKKAGASPEAVLSVVEANMARALRHATINQGVDVRELAITAFGGAGPLHACGLAEELGMAAVIVPPRAGVLSAIGILGSARQVDLVRSWHQPQNHSGLGEALDALAQQAKEELASTSKAQLQAGGQGAGDIYIHTGLDCRYERQSHEIFVPDVESFHEAHRLKNGYEARDFSVEVVALRAVAKAKPVLNLSELPDSAGHFGQNNGLKNSKSKKPSKKLEGPVVMAEPDTTVWIPEGWQAEEGAQGSLIIKRTNIKQRARKK